MPKYAYEWITETVDEHGDIVDTMCDSRYVPAGEGEEVALRRIEEDSSGEHEASGATWTYAYVKDGVLADTFDNGERVPLYKRREVERAHKVRS